MEKTIYKMNREAEALMKKTAADTNASETEFEAAATAMQPASTPSASTRPSRPSM